MKMRSHRFFLLFAVFFGAFFFFNTPEASAACTITKAQWGLTEVKTGEPVELRVSGSDCVGKLADISIFKGAELIQEGLKATFDPTGVFAKTTYSFLRETVTAAGGTSIKARFTARINGEGQNTSVPSEDITVTLNATTTTNAPGPVGQPVTFDFEIKNPLKINNFLDFITTITVWLTNIAIPVAVILIVYAGVLFLTAGAVPANVSRARTLLTYVVIGLSIILIGRGFITLIESVLNLGTGKVAGESCQTNQDCAEGLQCDGASTDTLGVCLKK